MIKSNAVLEINLKNLIYNFKSISKFANNSLTGATIKANAYGIGSIKTFKILYQNNCRHFFFATLEEALTLRKKSTKGNVYVLNGLENNKFSIFKKFNIIPILTSITELKEFIKSQYFKKKLKIGIHVETGLNRLGIKIEDLKKINTKDINLKILVSHLASADETINPYNLIQNSNFQSSFKLFKSIEYKSLANSAGILNNKNLHYDLVRPGISLYGGLNNIKLKKLIKIKPVINLKAKILQIKNINKHEFIGYNQTFKTNKKIKAAVLGIGYADGISRSLSNKGYAYFKNQFFKIIGRVSMDSITVDITNSNKIIKTGMYLELINDNNDIEKMAKICGTISNEILTSITNRVKRIYI